MPGDPSEERLAVVDEDDEPVDEAPRGEVHERALRHRTVHVLLANGDGRLWLQKRHESKRTHPNRWTSSASGHVRAGDGLREAARREVTEELGVPAPPLAYAGCLFWEDLDLGEREFSHVFAGVHGGPFEPNGDEVSGVAAFEPVEVDERLQLAPAVFADTFREIWAAGRAGDLEEGDLESLEV